MPSKNQLEHSEEIDSEGKFVPKVGRQSVEEPSAFGPTDYETRETEFLNAVLSDASISKQKGD